MLVSESIIFMTVRNDPSIRDDQWLDRLSLCMKAVQEADSGAGGWWYFSGDTAETIRGTAVGVEPEEFLPYLSGHSLELWLLGGIYFTLVYTGSFELLLRGRIAESSEEPVFQNRLQFQFSEYEGCDLDVDRQWMREFLQRQIAIWDPWHAGWYQKQWANECFTSDDANKKVPWAGFFTYFDQAPPAAATLTEAQQYHHGTVLTTPGDPTTLTYDDIYSYTQQLQALGFTGPEYVT